MSVILYSQPNFGGAHKHVIGRAEPDLTADGWGTRTASLQILPGTGTWQLTQGTNYSGGRVTVGAGSYGHLSDTGLPAGTLTALRQVAHGGAGIGTLGAVLFENPDFNGAHKHIVERDEPDLSADGWAHRVSSIIVLSGRWLVCGGAQYTQPRTLLKPGLYPRVADAGLPDDTLASLRRIAPYRWNTPDETPTTGGGPTNTTGTGYVTPVFPQLWQIVASVDTPTLNFETILYEHINFGGDHRHLINRSESNLHLDGWGDRASSVQVIFGPHWTFFRDIGFAGPSVSLPMGSYPFASDFGIPNDSISSVRFP